MPTDRVDPELLAVARGDRPASLLLVNARVVDVFMREVRDASVAIWDDRIAGVGDYTSAERVLDLGGSYVAPGLLDAHMHVESTMLLPPEFARLAAPHGTTGVVLDPHEIANVLGMDGIRLLMAQAEGVPMNMMFAASSCVPSSPLENSGASLGAADLAPLMEDDRVVALAEMMNFPGVVNADPGVLEKIRLGLALRIVDGHCPGLTGRALCAYVGAGISSDHECVSAAEALEKARLGLRVYLREGSAARNLEALLPAVTERNAHRFCFCTDDRHPGDLHAEGRIDHVIRKAVTLGLDPVTAIAMGTLNVAEHYRRPDLGAVAPGRFADLIIFDELRDLRPKLVLFHGRPIAEDGVITPGAIDRAPALDADNTVHLPPGLDASSLVSPASGPDTVIRVIGADPHSLLTEHLTLPGRVEGGLHVADPDRDILKLAVIGRRRGADGIGVGFVRGFGFRHGALASTVGHDAHNLSIVGTNDADMIAGARALAASGGGQCVVRDGEVLSLLPLPIAGLLSAEPAEWVIARQRELLEAARAIGCPLHDPFMPLSFLPLPVIPSLKLTDLGLVDVERFEVVPLEVDGG